MKKLILPFVLGAMMVSCSRDNDDAGLTPNPNNPTTPAETPVLLTKVVNTEEDGSIETTHFEYDGDKLVKIYGGYGAGSWSHESIITYDRGLITSIKDKSSTNEDDETIFTYDEQKRLKQVVRTSKEPTNIETITRYYTHNADGTVVVREIEKIEYVNAPSPNTEREKTITYTVRNGLIIKVENTEGGHTSTEIYTYDDKNAPMKNIRGIKEAIFEFIDESPISALAHNKISYEGGNDRRTFSYEYNDNNYPKKVIMTDEDNTTETYEFFYNK